MHSLTLGKTLHNSKLFFSKNELTKILSCYSLGVSKGKWKDYALNFKKNEAIFFMFKHSLASPDCILTKSIKTKKNKYIYQLYIENKNKNKFNEIDDLIYILKRKHIKIF